MKLKSKNDLKEIDIKNRMCYYFDDITTDRDIYCLYFIRRKNI